MNLNNNSPKEPSPSLEGIAKLLLETNKTLKQNKKKRRKKKAKLVSLTLIFKL